MIIVTRDTSALTCTAVRSVFESVDSLTKQVVVVDNGSKDDTPLVLPRDFPAMKYIRSETNLGFSRANNLGARVANGEFFLLLNSDARLKPDSLDLALSWMRKHPECGIAGGQLLNSDGSAQNSIANFPSLATELLNKSLLRRLFPRRFPGKEQHYPEPVEVESLIGAFMLVRAAVWTAIGGLDERYFFFLEETDFCLEARRRGWKVFHLPNVYIWHGQGKSVSSMPAAARIEYWRSRYVYFRKHHNRFTQTALVAGLGFRLLLGWLGNFVALAVCLGMNARVWHKFRLQTALLKWHLRGRPAECGLPR